MLAHGKKERRPGGKLEGGIREGGSDQKSALRSMKTKIEKEPALYLRADKRGLYRRKKIQQALGEKTYSAFIKEKKNREGGKKGNRATWLRKGKQSRVWCHFQRQETTRKEDGM